MDVFMANLPKLPLLAEMQVWDRSAIDFGLPETFLMENAGQAIYRATCELYKPIHTVALFMGGGNNGGDAACVARLLLDQHIQATIFCTKEISSIPPSARWHLELALKNRAMFIQLDPMLDYETFTSLIPEKCGAYPSLIIDGLLGTGFSGQLHVSAQTLIANINRFSQNAHIPVLSIDVPSGLDASTGLPSPIAIQAATTITLAAAKPGLLQASARPYTGELICRSIHIPTKVIEDAPSRWRLLNGLNLTETAKYPPNTYKNHFGHIYVFGSQHPYTGAGKMAALAALRAGSGLVTLCSPGFLTDVPSEIMNEALDTDWSVPKYFDLEKLYSTASAIVIGPGLGRSTTAGQLLHTLLTLPNRPPFVIDADALYHLAKLDLPLSENDILTPHPGEAGLLLNCSAKDIQMDRQNALDMLCNKYPAIIVLKGAYTLIGQGEHCRILCPYDIPQLAISGAGDVLAGCIGGAIASRPHISRMGHVAYAVLQHAMAALLLSKSCPQRGLLASELANALPCVFDFVATQHIPVEGMLPWPR